MESEEFQKYAHDLVDWMVTYFKEIDQYPVKSQVSPLDILNSIPDSAPQTGENMQEIIDDFKTSVLPGITHWQNPKFFAYFPANASLPSLLAEMITATLATQCMIWDTSPAAAELEEKMMDWLKEMLGLPKDWSGVIQDGASTVTLAALLTAREKNSGFCINETGFQQSNQYRIYCSTEAHSSVEKAVKIAGFGRKNLSKIPVNQKLELDVKIFEQQIQEDKAAGLIPLFAVAAVGTTGTTAIDPVKEMAIICEQNNIWLHIDAAYAGTALLLPEYRWMINGLEKADSFVFNPHKWMFTHFDCTAYFVKDPEALIRTFEILPEYLKTKSRGQVNDYRDWGIPMGRRFRALKLWFVIRSFGIDGLKAKVLKHINLAKQLESWIEINPDFEILIKRTLNLVCFRYHPQGLNNENQINELNQKLLEKLNASGEMFLTHTKIYGKYALRMVIAQTNVDRHHIEEAWTLIQKFGQELN